jgi:hypothetical protein
MVGYIGGVGYTNSRASLTDEDKSLYTDKLVSATNFADITTALADSSVSTAQAGDFVKIDGIIHHIIKNNPTTADDVVSSGGLSYPIVNTFNDLPSATDNNDKIYVVKTTTGIIGFRKKSGLYYSNGIDWKRLSENQLKVNDSDKLNGISGSLYLLKADEKFTDMLKSKLDGIEAGATINDTDANLKNRANHTGTQTASTISDFDTEVSNNTAVVNKVDKNTDITGATKTKITYDTKGLVITGADLAESDIPTLSQSKITNLTTDLSNKSDNTHNHNLNNLTEKSYNSLTDKPDLSDLHSHANKTVLDATTASFTTADKTKLDGVEDNATADMTATEIKTSYESNVNTNAFTDANKIKLDGIDMNTKVDKITSTDNAIVRFNGTSGEVQNSGATIDDNINLTVKQLSLETGVGSNRGTSLYNSSLYNRVGELSVYPTGTGDIKSSIRIIPKGAGYSAGNIADLNVYSTDYVADSVNYQYASILAKSDEFQLWTRGKGSLPELPLRISAGKGNPQLYLAVNQNVGIGTTTPTEKFEVNGKIKATSINFSGLPTSSVGLSSGDVWNDGGVLKIV